MATTVAPPAPKGGIPTGPPAADKKGEVNELRTVSPHDSTQFTAAQKHFAILTYCLPLQLLRSVNTEKDSKRKRDIIKKVIAYMTLGIDVSRLFTEMILVSNLLFCYLPDADYDKPTAKSL
jgi:hypothetical protein